MSCFRSVKIAVFLTLSFIALQSPSKAGDCIIFCASTDGEYDIEAETEHRIETDHTIRPDFENVDELIDLLNAAGYNLERAERALGEEARLTIDESGETAEEVIGRVKDELSEYTDEVNQYAGQRIADLDERIQNKLIFIATQIEKVNEYSIGIIEAIGGEAQEILDKIEKGYIKGTKVTGQEARDVIAAVEEGYISGARETGEQTRQTVSSIDETLARNIADLGLQYRLSSAATGQELQALGRLYGDELRLTILTGSDEVVRVTDKISSEAQSLIGATSGEIKEILELVLDDIDNKIVIVSTEVRKINADIEDSRKNYGKVVFFVVSQTVDRAFAFFGIVGGLLLLFIMTFSWVRLLYLKPLPTHPISRNLTFACMTGTVFAALAPFSLAHAGLRANILKYTGVATSYESLEQAVFDELPEIWYSYPSIIDLEDESVSLLEVTGINFNIYPVEARYGSLQLDVITQLDENLIVDISPIQNAPESSNKIEFFAMVPLEEKTLIGSVGVVGTPLKSNAPSTNDTGSNSLAEEYTDNANELLEDLVAPDDEIKQTIPIEGGSNSNSSTQELEQSGTQNYDNSATFGVSSETVFLSFNIQDYSGFSEFNSINSMCNRTSVENAGVDVSMSWEGGMRWKGFFGSRQDTRAGVVCLDNSSENTLTLLMIVSARQHSRVTESLTSLKSYLVDQLLLPCSTPDCSDSTIGGKPPYFDFFAPDGADTGYYFDSKEECVEHASQVLKGDPFTSTEKIQSHIVLARGSDSITTTLLCLSLDDRVVPFGIISSDDSQLSISLTDNLESRWYRQYSVN